MSLSEYLTKVFRFILPSPFTIAIILTFITFILALLLTRSSDESYHLINLISYWEKGIWNSNLLVFAFQMMMMLVLGHALALTRSVTSLIEKVTFYCSNTARAAAIVTMLTLIVSLFNWGLGLIFGAIFARKVGEYASQKNIKINYPLIGACGYSGLMVWHGGLSGSAPIKVAEQGHLNNLLDNPFFTSEQSISLSETIFSTMNISISISLIIILPISMYILGKKYQGKVISLNEEKEKKEKENIDGAERLDHSKIISSIFSLIILAYCFYKAFILPVSPSLSVIDPNFINLLLLALGLLLHGDFYHFTKAISSAIGGASGILIQFPLYFGIMGLMKDSGMVSIISDFFVSISNDTTFPIFTFISAGIVNIFVPSGGGQWAIQGPIILEAASILKVSYSKSIMALAYGDQITNMLQPFWALPLLGITKLKANDILPYTLYLFMIGLIIFIGGLLIF